MTCEQATAELMTRAEAAVAKGAEVEILRYADRVMSGGMSNRYFVRELERTRRLLCLPLSAVRLPQSAFRLPLSAIRSPLSAFRNPLSAARSPRTVNAER